MKNFLSFLLVFLLFPSIVYAKIGVGVGAGKIKIDDKLQPGTIYQLPLLTVLNTGDEPSDYEVSITYHEKQPENMPPQNWFIFSPQKFSLEPAKGQAVNIKLNLPVSAKPGDYFAYLEAHPVKKTESGNTTIGIAAATRLYFTVVPSNIFQGIYYKAVSFWNVYAPWPKRIVVGFSIIIIILLFKKFFNVQIDFRKKPVTKEK
jgi:P pilus assembly chaperone PapD